MAVFIANRKELRMVLGEESYIRPSVHSLFSVKYLDNFDGVVWPVCLAKRIILLHGMQYVHWCLFSEPSRNYLSSRKQVVANARAL